MSEHKSKAEAEARREPFRVDEHDLLTREPEALNVGQLNRAVRMLRERLYEQRLEVQAALERAAKAEQERDEALGALKGVRIATGVMASYANPEQIVACVLAQASDLVRLHNEKMEAIYGNGGREDMNAIASELAAVITDTKLDGYAKRRDEALAKWRKHKKG